MPLSVGLLAAAQKASTGRPQPTTSDPTSNDSWRGRAQYRQQLDARLGPRTHFAIDPSVIAPTSAFDAQSSSKSSKGKRHALNAPWAAQPTESRSGPSASPPEAVHAHGQAVFSPALPKPTKSSGATVSVQTLHNPADWEYDPNFASRAYHNHLWPGLGLGASIPPRARTLYTSSYPGRGRRPETKPLPYLFVMTYVRPQSRTRHAPRLDRPTTSYGSSTTFKSVEGSDEEKEESIKTPPANASVQSFGGAAKRRRTDGSENPYSIPTETVPRWTRDNLFTTTA